MIDDLRRRVLPENQRRTLEELTDDLVLRSGDAGAKQSAFWIMLTLSGVIASAGVIADSTATVIGAMIIAPLSTPIMGIALSSVRQERNGSATYVVLGASAVVGIGVVFSLVLTGSYDLLANSQISGRTSPRLIDLVAAAATGLAGAVALARRDVAAVLPGVAIAISLVPPLAVVGVCLGQGAPALALGALLLFLSNLVALVLCGTLVFGSLGYGEGATGPYPRHRVRMTLLTALVVLPLAANTAATYAIQVWSDRVRSTADDWVSSTSGARVTDVQWEADTARIAVETPGELPPVADLMKALDGEVPDGITIVVDTSLGENLHAGTTGE
ncbi:DUF389 domain-containing protein [Nocardioides taihuensis]|uniref:DUF389 domain-containing protein n=1 Tax=Nocardioides taihuensis TaxID=1835606 RepID=A0ABW0BJR5_9ACTN